MSQRDDVLRMLREAGSRGVHTFELRQAYIGNPSQRIAELEDAGHVITHTREKLNGKAVGTRYRLATATVSGPPAVSSPPPAGGPETTDALFTVPTRAESLTFEDCFPPPRNAINDDLEAA